MRGDPKVRVGTLKDLDALVDLEERGFASDRFSRQQFQYLLTKANATVLVLVYRRKVGGTAIMLWRKNVPVGRLYSIIIDPNLQGKRLGTIMLRACEREASKRKCDEVSLEVRSDNKQAIGFYEKHQYKVVDSLPGYYSDGMSGLRMVKSLLGLESGQLHLKIPYYSQTLEFTCGSACLMMAFKHFCPETTLNRLLEVTLWRESTLVFMTSGMGGCGPFGLSLAAQLRGFPVKVMPSREQSPFFSSVRKSDKRQVIRIIHDDLKERAIGAGVRVKFQEVTFKDIEREMHKGRVPIVLISTYRLHGDRAPHWVVLTGFDSEYVYFHDSYEGFYEHDRKLAQNVKIPIAEFNRMKRYGKDLYKCALFISGPDSSPR